jgi:NAD-dependent SIR2 family protein deacetylase
MLATERELILDFKELGSIALECAECHAQTILDATQKKTRVPARCPSCQTDFDPVSVQGALSSFLDTYRLLSQVKHRITLRVKVSEKANGQPATQI